MPKLYEKDKPSGCSLSDSCNYIIGCAEEHDPFSPMSDEEFSDVMIEISMCINAVFEHSDTLSATLTREEFHELLVSIKRVNKLATIEMNENRNLD